jgi:hypothetical protein
MWPSDRKQRITKMTTKIVRLVSLAPLLWDYLSRSVYSKKKHGLGNLQHHNTAACVAEN